MGDPSETADFSAMRKRMVAEQISARGITDHRLLEAMLSVERHRFVPKVQQAEAYSDKPLPIGLGQTISQPYIVALMIATANIQPQSRVLEIGTGCGYQTAVLARLSEHVFSIEINELLARQAAAMLGTLAPAVRLKQGDGNKGWLSCAPFDAIIVSAAAPQVPAALCDQLAPEGRLVIPVGATEQELVLIEREAEGFKTSRITRVRFVPLLGEES